MEQILHLNRVFLEIQIGHLRSINKLTEEALVQYEMGLGEWYLQQREIVDDDESEEDRELLDAEYKELKDDAATSYRQIVRASLFGTAYGIFEHFLIRICQQHRAQSSNQGLSLHHLRGDGIERAKLYLAKVAMIILPETNEWQDLRDYGSLRNSFVHEQGYITGERSTRIKQLQNRVGTFQIRTTDTQAILLDSFNSKFLDLIESLGNQVEKTVEHPNWWSDAT